MRILALVGAAALLAACGEAADIETVEVDDAVVEAAGGEVDTGEELELATQAVADAELSDEQNIALAPAGEYVDEDTHAYIAFAYSHQGYSNPILRFNGDAFEARMNLVPEDPTASTLTVSIDPAEIDSGVDAFNEHLVSADMFDVATHPEITFTTTSLSMDSPTSGTLLGDLTMKGITKPLALDVTLNKVGENFRSKRPMFGVSATGKLKRSEWDLGYATPFVGDDVDLMIEVEFEKADWDAPAEE